MIYLEYEVYKTKFLDAQRLFNETLTEQERLFTRTQPNAIRYDKDSVQGGISENPLEEYVISKEEKRIDEKLKSIRQLLDDRWRLLELKENELRKSHDKMDMVYLYRYVDGHSPNRIAKTLNYSKSQVYRMMNQIQCTIRKHATKCEKIYDSI